MRAHMVKAGMHVADRLLRRIFYLHDLPAVGAAVFDVPYGLHPQQRADIFVPPGEPPFPVLVYVHGGGWIGGDKASFERVGRSFAERSVLFVSLNYRLGPRSPYPWPMHDVTRALRWVRENVASYGGDPDTLFLGGCSAGAQLASWYAVAAHTPALLEAVGVPITAPVPLETLKGLLLFYGGFDLETARETRFPAIRTFVDTFLEGHPRERPERARVASPLRHLVAGLPPMLVCSGEPDSLHAESVALVRALAERGLPHQALLFSKAEHPESHHGFLNFYERPCTRLATERAIAFIGATRAGASG